MKTVRVQEQTWKDFVKKFRELEQEVLLNG
jgi:hypothetical protein